MNDVVAGPHVRAFYFGQDNDFRGFFHCFQSVWSKRYPGRVNGRWSNICQAGWGWEFHQWLDQLKWLPYYLLHSLMGHAICECCVIYFSPFWVSPAACPNRASICGLWAGNSMASSMFSPCGNVPAQYCGCLLALTTFMSCSCPVSVGLHALWLCVCSVFIFFFPVVLSSQGTKATLLDITKAYRTPHCLHKNITVSSGKVLFMFNMEPWRPHPSRRYSRKHGRCGSSCFETPCSSQLLKGWTILCS